MFSTSDNLITLIHYGADDLGREILTHAQSEGLLVRDIDISITRIANSLWSEIAQRLGIEIRELVNLNHPSFSQHYDSEVQLTEDDWLKFLEHNPSTLLAPIAVKGEHIRFIQNFDDVHYFTVDY